MDNQQPFPNGNAATLSLMPGLALLPGQFGAAGLPEMPPNESAKMEPPTWGMPDPVQDKQHPVNISILKIVYLSIFNHYALLVTLVNSTKRIYDVNSTELRNKIN